MPMGPRHVPPSRRSGCAGGRSGARRHGLRRRRRPGERARERRFVRPGRHRSLGHGSRLDHPIPRARAVGIDRTRHAARGARSAAPRAEGAVCPRAGRRSRARHPRERLPGPDVPGPPAPDIRARIIGHQVEVEVEYARLPRSPACRPAVLDVVVHTRRSDYHSVVQHYTLRGPRGRAVIDLPWYGRPPYRLVATSTTIAGRRGPAAERRLRCPGTGDFVDGCLPGYRPGLHSYPMPTPVLPLQGVTRSALESTLRYVLAGEQAAAGYRSARCPTLGRCEVTYADPSFPASPYRIVYRIAGQQGPGCWLGVPREDPRSAAVRGRQPRTAPAGRLRLLAALSSDDEVRLDAGARADDVSPGAVRPKRSARLSARAVRALGR